MHNLLALKRQSLKGREVIETRVYLTIFSDVEYKVLRDEIYLAALSKELIL
jgi:hypothetical protein